IDVSVNLLRTKPFETLGTMPGWVYTTTDDRGIYRLYGVPPGEYRVRVGELPAYAGMRGRLAWTPTYYPDSTEVTSAKTLIVENGKELTDIDIKMSPPQPLFTISGSVIDAETGAPMNNVRVGMMIYSSNISSGGRIGNDFSNSDGTFRLDGVPPG